MLHELSDATRIYSMSVAHPPALTINVGDTVRFQTRDCFDGQVPMEENPENLDKREEGRGNPATGPVYVSGAAAGHTLVCSLQDVQLAPQGLICSQRRDGSERTVTVVNIEGTIAHMGKWQFPVEPVVGVMGVAPGSGEVPNSTPGAHGGNMDTPDLVIGSKLYLPVFHPGALFGCGDVHALQGDGEVCGQGIEIAAQVTVGFELLDHPVCPWPVVETPTHYDIIAAGEDLDEAGRFALLAARDFLIKYANATDQEALALMSTVGDLRICQIVDPLLGVRACVPKELVAGPL